MSVGYRQGLLRWLTDLTKFLTFWPPAIFLSGDSPGYQEFKSQTTREIGAVCEREEKVSLRI